MVLFGELAVRFFDFVIRRALVYAQHLVIISFIISHMLRLLCVKLCLSSKIQTADGAGFCKPARQELL